MEDSETKDIYSPAEVTDKRILDLFKANTLLPTPLSMIAQKRYTEEVRRRLMHLMVVGLPITDHIIISAIKDGPSSRNGSGGKRRGRAGTAQTRVTRK